jgi:hypothetical protein
MSRSVSTSAWQRFWCHGLSRPKTSAVFVDRCRRVGEGNHLPSGSTGVVGIVLFGTVYAAATRATKNNATTDPNDKGPCLRFHSLGYVRSMQTHRAQCEPILRHFAEVLDQEFDDESGYTEAERFYQCLDYHRSLLSDYTRRWSPKLTSDRPLAGASGGAVAGAFRLDGLNSENSNAAQWPRNIPLAHEVSALECDLRYCQRGSKSSGGDDCPSQRLCQDAKFRIAAFYVAQSQSESQKLGFQMLKELAESNHADGMCYYGETKPIATFTFSCFGATFDFLHLDCPT